MARLSLEDCASQRSPGRLLRRVDKLMTAFVESRIDGCDLSFMQWVALKVVRDGVVRNAGELARELGITSGATTRLIDGLEARGMLARDRDAADRRVVTLGITDEGARLVATIQHDVVDSWNAVLAEFTPGEVEGLVAILIRLLAAVERVTDGLELVERSAQ